MALRSYQKSNNSYQTEKQDTEFAYLDLDKQTKQTKQHTDMWSISAKAFSGLKKVAASSSLAGLLVPGIFIGIGAGVIYQQFQPLLAEQLKQQTGYYDQGTTSLVDEKYIAERLQYVSNPGSDYFEQLASAASATGFTPDTESQNYKGIMYLTIPSLGFKRLPVKANVESSIKSAYDQVLTSSLAHFGGTSLPVASNPSNIVIYGHSAGGAYNPNPNDVLAAFSFLSELKVGDEITLEVDGQKHKYRMSRSKIVKPDDTSIITGTPGRESLTLFTCWPAGNNSQRYVAVATPVN